MTAGQAPSWLSPRVSWPALGGGGGGAELQREADKRLARARAGGQSAQIERKQLLVSPFGLRAKTPTGCCHRPPMSDKMRAQALGSERGGQLRGVGRARVQLFTLVLGANLILATTLLVVLLAAPQPASGASSMASERRLQAAPTGPSESDAGRPANELQGAKGTSQAGEEASQRPADVSLAGSEDDEIDADSSGQRGRISKQRSQQQAASGGLANESEPAGESAPEAAGDEYESTSEETATKAAAADDDEAAGVSPSSDEREAQAATPLFEPIQLRPSQPRRRESPSGGGAATWAPVEPTRRSDESGAASFDLELGADRVAIARPAGEAPLPAESIATSSRQPDERQLGGKPFLRSSSGGESASFAAESQLNQGEPSICYTPMALILVVLVTIAITLTCCLCAYLAMKHLKSHQFGKCFTLFETDASRFIRPRFRLNDRKGPCPCCRELKRAPGSRRADQ